MIRCVCRSVAALLGVGIATMAGICMAAGVVENPASGAALLQKVQQRGALRVIVQVDTAWQAEGELASATAVADQQQRIATVQQQVVGRLAGTGVQAVKQLKTIPYMAMRVDAAALARLQQDSAVLSVVEDVPVPPTLDKSVPFINADNVHRSGNKGSGYAVAVLDTGVRKTHEFLDGGKVIAEACYSWTGDGSTSVCPNGQNQQLGSGAGVNCTSTIGGCSHGTHVAGIAAGTGGTPGVGVAPSASIIAVQVFSRFDGTDDCGSDTPCVMSWTEDQMAALEYIYSLRNTYKIAAVNMSLGGGAYSSYCDDGDGRKDLIDNLRAAGIATVIASGNDYYTGYISAPGCISSAVTVGATGADSSGNPLNSVADYSNHSSLVDLLAPGSSINSSVATGNTSYASWNGTSMATPHVAGAFALMKSLYPTWSVSQIETWLKNNGVAVSRGGISKPRINLQNAVVSRTPSLAPLNYLLLNN